MRRLEGLLRILAGFFLLAALVYLVGPFVSGAFRGLPFVGNSVVKVTILALLCLYAAGDPVRYRGLVKIVLAAHAVSVLAMGFLIALGKGTTVLWVAIGLDGVILAVLGAVFLSARVPKKPRAARPFPGPMEQWLRRVLIGLAVILFSSAFLYEAGPFLDADVFRELPFVTNSVVKVTTLALVCLFALRDVTVVGPIIAAHVSSLVASLLYLTTWREGVLWGAILVDGLIAAVLFAFYQGTWKERLKHRFFSPTEYRTLIGLADVMAIGGGAKLAPGEVAANVDGALARMRSPRRGVFRVGLRAIHFLPLMLLRPPMPVMSRGRRAQFVRWHFFRTRLQFARNFLRVGHQLNNLGYYNDPRVNESIGYTPFTQRPRFPGLDVKPENKPLRVEHPWELPGDVLEADVCVVGTGAGGAVIAQALAEKGRSVLMLERGRHVEPRLFTENELRMIETLYDGGMLQVSEDFRFNVLQGNCVGGSTTVNNGICLPPDRARIESWKELDVDGVFDALAWVEHELGIRPLTTEHHPRIRHHRALELIEGHLSGFALEEPKAFPVNMQDCVGCGYCNTGCAWDKKLSMLQSILPDTQQKHGNLRIVDECAAHQLRTRSGTPKRVEDLVIRFSDGRFGRVQAETFVVAGGAIGSSKLLMRSGIDSGHGLSFNMITPVFAEFAEELNSYDAIQMGHYIEDRSKDFILETWFSPPVGLSTAMGGWFGRHMRNMQAAGKMVAFGVVVGTQANGRVLDWSLARMPFRYEPVEADLQKMRRGLDTLLRLLLRAGARKVILNTWDEVVFARESDVDRHLGRVLSNLTVASSHPQGGNALGTVLDEHFRVRGYGNLHVADASVFPGSVQVNPQMTVMALARYAGERMG